MKNATTAGIVYAAITAIGLGSLTTQAKMVYAAGGDSITLMLVRFVVSSLLIGLFVLLRRESFAIDKDRFWPVIKLGLIWSGSMICYLKSVELISVSLAVLILYTYPLLVLLVSIFNRQMPVTFLRISLFVLAFIGLAFALFSGDVNANGLGLLFSFGAAMGAAYTFYVGAKVAPDMSPWVMAFWVNFLGIALILPFLGGGLALPETGKGMLALTGVTLFYVIAIVSQFAALARLSAPKASFLLNFEPVVSILLAVLLLNETLVSSQWAGVVLIMLVLFGSIRVLFKTAPEEGN